LVALTPASYPAWNALISGTLTPPMKPTEPVFEAFAATPPTRYDAWLAANTRLARLGAVKLESSTIAKLVLGYFGTTALIAPAYGKPIARVGGEAPARSS